MCLCVCMCSVLMVVEELHLVDSITSPTVLSGAKSELKRRSYGQNSVRYPLDYCDSDCDSVTIAVIIARADDCASDCATGTIAWHYSLRCTGSIGTVFLCPGLGSWFTIWHGIGIGLHGSSWGFVSCKRFEELSIRFKREEVA
ncbi:hypothetical protein L6452_20904 [Arctium lappa]|uniref:Uncharacterized protein n=1 Tax=Arctium lappa TaxID=4217 RepID=A0ACB9BD75_ARCLA|nr:hypothetical protein L6452_20904 [Arctium lappa]